MDPRHLFADSRFTGLCVYCGTEPDTRDHVPSRILLDEPFPTDLPVVPCCSVCNNGFSLDEQYLACLIECVIRGSVDPELVQREKVGRILRDHPALASRILESRQQDLYGNILWAADIDRVRNVILKLARGHAAWEYSEPQLNEPKSLSFLPICVMSAEQVQSFEASPAARLWPELGSRAFLRAVVVGNEVFTQEGNWSVLQEGRYRYAVSHSEQIMVRVVLSEYLACEVVW